MICRTKELPINPSYTKTLLKPSKYEKLNPNSTIQHISSNRTRKVSHKLKPVPAYSS